MVFPITVKDNTEIPNGIVLVDNFCTGLTLFNKSIESKVSCVDQFEFKNIRMLVNNINLLKPYHKDVV